MYSADIPSHLRLEARRSPTRTRSSKAIIGDSLCSPMGWCAPSGRTTASSRTAPRRSRSDRDLPVPAFRVIDGPDALEIITARFHLRYDRGPFSPSGLRIRPPGIGQGPRGVEVRRGRGPRRHRADARRRRRAHRAPERGRLAQGCGRHRRLRIVAFTDDGWVSPRVSEGIDLYVFAYAHDYAEALRALLHGVGPAAGAAPLGAGQLVEPVPPLHAGLVPRAARPLRRRRRALLGGGARHGLAPRRQRASRVRAAAGRATAGSREYFPDPEAFLAELHDRGMRVTLNLHPADGVRAFEDAYPAMAEALGRDPELGERIAFDINDPDFLEAYLRCCIIRSRRRAWTSGGWTGSTARTPASRASTRCGCSTTSTIWMPRATASVRCCCRATPGRAATATPSDSRATRSSRWESLAFQPEFTATASNIGYGWWSHDIGGHMGGRRDDELTTRWVQLGVYSPILRLHSSDIPFLSKEPWALPRLRRGPRSARRCACACSSCRICTP